MVEAGALGHHAVDEHVEAAHGRELLFRAGLPDLMPQPGRD
jgi:hypothetical protein